MEPLSQFVVWRGSKDKCLNFNHGRINAPVRFCPTCGGVVNENITIRVAEELFYYNIFERCFDHPDAVNLIGKWKGKIL
jgi:hypothetical protein